MKDNRANFHYARRSVVFARGYTGMQVAERLAYVAQSLRRLRFPGYNTVKLNTGELWFTPG